MCVTCQEIFAYGIMYFYSGRAGELLGHMEDSWMLVLIFFVKQSKISPRACICVLPLKL